MIFDEDGESVADLSDVELEGFVHEDGQSRNERVEAPVEAELTDIERVHRHWRHNGAPRNTVVLRTQSIHQNSSIYYWIIEYLLII